MTRPLRIEMMLPSLPRAGMEVLAGNLAETLRERGHNVGFTCIEGPGELGQQLRDEGFRVSVVPAPGLRPNFVARELGSWLQERAPDVVHVHNGLWLKSVRAARHAGVPRVIYTLHGIDLAEPLYNRYLNRMAARHTARVVAVSETLRAYLRTNARVAPERIVVIPNGVSTARFRPGPRSDSERARFGFPGPEHPVIGVVARLDPVKDHALLLDAFALVIRERPDAFLAIVGDGPLRGRLEQQIDSLGIAAHVRIMGVQPEPAALLRQLDVFALTSEIEGTSMSILEAMATGLPVVATAVGGTPALLRDGECGRLVGHGDPHAFARAILDVISDPQMARRIGERARGVVEQRHSLARMTDEYEKVYREAWLASGRSPVLVER
jgi:glycosyltransferase involved in cell wall biosynthesis